MSFSFLERFLKYATMKKKIHIVLFVLVLGGFLCFRSVTWAPNYEQESFRSNDEKDRKCEVSFVVQIYRKKNFDLMELQLKNIKRFLECSFEYHAVLARSLVTEMQDPSTSSETVDIRRNNAIKFHTCPFEPLDLCLDYTVETVIPVSSSFHNIVILLNVDMFLLKTWDPVSYLNSVGNPDINVVVEDHTLLPPYFHPGLVILNVSNIPNISSLSFVKKEGGDVGSSTSSFLLSNPKTTVRPMVWSRHLSLADLVARELLDQDIFKFIRDLIEVSKTSDDPIHGRGPDLYTNTFSWFHLRDISCWSEVDCKLKQSFISFKLPILLSRLYSKDKNAIDTTLDLVCNCCAESTTTGHRPMCDTRGNLLPSTGPIKRKEIQPRKPLPISKVHDPWMKNFFEKSDEIKHLVESKKLEIKEKIPLPLPIEPFERKNLEFTPKRHDPKLYQRETSYYWRFVYNGTQENEKSEVANCKARRDGQKFWVATYADGPTRRWIAHHHTRPSCLLHGVDEVKIWGPEDFDSEYSSRNEDILRNEHGKGLWIWKHYVQYRTLREMSDGDILLYIDSDFRCDPSILQYFCLAQQHDIVGFHHSHPDYTLSKLASRDSMILMNLDNIAVTSSVQSSGGNIMFKKSKFSINFILEMAAWSQQIDVVGNRGKPSKLGLDWKEYQSSNYNHQCDQAISSLMLIKYGCKTFPWHLEGYGAGSDDELNLAQRRECGLNERPMSIHVRDDFKISWPSKADLRDLAQLACMEFLKQLVEGPKSLYLEAHALCSHHGTASCRKFHSWTSAEGILQKVNKEIGEKMLEVPLDQEYHPCISWTIHTKEIKNSTSVDEGKLNNANSCLVNSKKVTKIETILSSIPNIPRDKILHFRIACHGCVFAMLKHAWKENALRNLTFIEFETGFLPASDLCQVYELLEHTHTPIFQFQNSWERWALSSMATRSITPSRMVASW